MASRSLSLSTCQSCLRAALRTRPSTGARQLRLPSRSVLEEQQRVRVPHNLNLNLQSMSALFSTSARSRKAASSATPPPPPAKGNGPIVLEQPDKFRPPSHPQRLGRRRPQPAAYNQGTTRSEREKQKTKSYPHMFPNQGTFMHWFLTNRMIHVWITLGTLVTLATISLTVTFMKTSPYAHLIPPISTLPFHPITYLRESIAVLRLHIDYTTERTEASRQAKVLDAQKRRLYRRAHGMEDLNAEEEQGIDVRGIVPWDDGLTNKERANGGRDAALIRTDPYSMLPPPPSPSAKVAGQESPAAATAAMAGVPLEGGEALPTTTTTTTPTETEEDPSSSSSSSPQQPPPQQRKRKLYFGIW